MYPYYYKNALNGQSENALRKSNKVTTRMLHTVQIIEAAAHKAAGVRRLASRFTNHSSKTRKTCEVQLEKQRRF